MNTMEDLRLEVVGTLYSLNSDHLIAVCDFLNIAGTQRENVLGKSRSFLIAHIVNYIERDEVGSRDPSAVMQA